MAAERLTLLLALLVNATSASVFSGPVAAKSLFCNGVTWNASQPLPPAELDAAAKYDFEAARIKLAQLDASPLCLESWKALQCASKFIKSSREYPFQKVCRTLCRQFAETCNGSNSVLARCTDNELYDEPPCTDYVDFTPYPGRWIGAPLPMPTNISSSPGELFETAAGLPLLLTLAVLILHATCYAAQLLCGGREDTEPEDFLSPRDAMNATIARGGLRADQAPLLPSKSA